MNSRNGEKAHSTTQQEEPGLPAGSYSLEDVNGLEETKGCAVLDPGATINCSSTTAAEEIHTQHLNRQEPGLPVISQSDRRFRCVDGRVDESQKVREIKKAELLCS